MPSALGLTLSLAAALCANGGFLIFGCLWLSAFCSAKSKVLVLGLMFIAGLKSIGALNPWVSSFILLFVGAGRTGNFATFISMSLKTRPNLDINLFLDKIGR